MISGDMTVARLLEEHPELVEVLAGYNAHFKQLRNRLLRRVMAPRVTVAQAAGMAGVPADELLGVLRRAVGEDAPPERTEAVPSPSQAEGQGEGGRPPTLAAIPEARRVHVDVRDDIRRGQEPFAKIMAAVKGLQPDRVLVLRAPFEPIPLYDVLGKRGFAHWTEQRGSDDWSVWFYRSAAPTPAAPREAPPAGGGRRVLDVRGLEPPQPMLRVLEEAERLAPGAELEVRHDRRPLFLYPQLEDRGFRHETDEPEPGLVRILIRRNE
ncbi:MAG TPA: DUF2249 domain-containing protein [Methylomirabilota bacterium]|nr:DUF2249 domain-containing protein [Methylomirabilota bacterium]